MVNRRREIKVESIGLTVDSATEFSQKITTQKVNGGTRTQQKGMISRNSSQGNNSRFADRMRNRHISNTDRINNVLRRLHMGQVSSPQGGMSGSSVNEQFGGKTNNRKDNFSNLLFLKPINSFTQVSIET